MTGLQMGKNGRVLRPFSQVQLIETMICAGRIDKIGVFGPDKDRWAGLSRRLKKGEKSNKDWQPGADAKFCCH